MKLLQINTVYGKGSTGRICREIAAYAETRGHEVYTAYGYGPKDPSPYAYRIQSRLSYTVHNVLSRLWGLEGYFSRLATRRLLRYIRRLKPDVIHLHNLHGHYLCLPMLFRFLEKEKLPVVQHVHDCWSFTGGCTHYTAIGCDKYRSSCGGCPRVHEYPSSWFLDRTKKMRADKERWYRGVDSLTVVGVSQWSADQARSSFLSSCARSITHVYNWIDTSVFYPRTDERAAVRRAYGVDEHAFVVLGVSANWTVGSVRYEDMCKLAERLPEGALLVLVGAAADGFPTERIRHIPYVAGKDEMARLYSAADVYVHASVEDTFGLVIAEAMACGTPAIVYDATGCPELVGEGCGCVVPVRDTDAVLCSIDAVRRAGKDAYTAACVANVRERFDYSTNAERILALYEAMIE